MIEISCLESQVKVGGIVDLGLSKILTETYENSKKIILVDENTNELCLPHLLMHVDGLDEAEIIELPSGEENKTMEMSFSVWEALSEMELGRNDLFICLGGGVICDMGGFIAALYKRGMNCIYIPTSLLSMVDASVGGKTGVDLGPFKNQLGTFSFPSEVLIDSAFLETLPESEKLNGLAEMVKHGLIADKTHFEDLAKIEVDQISDELIQHSIQIKAKIVEQDPKEKGPRKLLNFGHTVGHAIEGALLNTQIQMAHGLAVAHGMLVEAKISVLLELLGKEEFEYIQSVLKSRFVFEKFSKDKSDVFLELMRQDKKRIDGESNFTLLKSIGVGVFDVSVSDKIVSEALETLN